MDLLTRVLNVCLGGLYVTTMAAFVGIFGNALSAQEDSYSKGEKLFALKVKPLLKQKCFACHGAEDEIKGDLNLTNRKEMLSGGESSDQVLVPGNGKGSLLYQSTTRKSEDYLMPPKEADKLTEEQTWLIRDWIDAGAPWPSDEDQAIILEKYAEGDVVQTSGGLDDDWTNRRKFLPRSGLVQPPYFGTPKPRSSIVQNRFLGQPIINLAVSAFSVPRNPKFVRTTSRASLPKRFLYSC